MKTALSLLLAVGCLNSFGQTNSSRVPSEWFSLSQVQLRQLSVDDELEIPEIAEEFPSDSRAKFKVATLEKSDRHAKTNSTLILEQNVSATRDLDAALVRKLEAQGCFEQKPQPPDNYFVRALGEISEPEVIHVGKTTVSCSIIDAVKKKNPLCLLNFMILTVSW